MRNCTSRCNRQFLALLQLITLLLTVSAAASSTASSICPSASATVAFHVVTGFDCVSPEFYRLVPVTPCGVPACSLLCTRTPDCRAFSLPAGDLPPICQCKLFLFNRCSHRVQSVPACERPVTVYVRSLPGVNPGSLCPGGFGHARFGTAYRVMSEQPTNWTGANQVCSSQAGLVKFADALDADEMQHLMWLRNVTSGSSTTYFLGGYQSTDAVNKTDGWLWDACSRDILQEVWEPGRPNVGLMGAEPEGCVSMVSAHTAGINDGVCGKKFPHICECLAVFN